MRSSTTPVFIIIASHAICGAETVHGVHREAPVFHADRAELLKHMGQDEDIDDKEKYVIWT